VKRIKMSRVDSPDGEIHFVLEEPQTFEECECITDVREIKEISKKEATKPLILFREE
jgi:hypothetical protein